MTKRHRLVVLFGSVAAVIAGAGVASAQFETPNRSFHNATAFRLDGRHQTVPCASCHLNGQFAGTPTTCYDCHWVRRKDDRFQTRLGTQCEQCHRPVGWSAVQFDHGGLAGVPLNTDHRLLNCESCHKAADVRAGAVACVSCHRKDYDMTRAPAHAAAGFPTTCEGCHRPNDAVWQSQSSAGFDHAAVFPLVGAHAAQSCISCHRNNVYKGTPTACLGCHQADYQQAQNPNHAAANFPTTCDSCHRPADPGWRGGIATFNHNEFFPLVGMHASQACASCHRNNIYQGTPRQCFACHAVEYERTQTPNHAAAGFPTSCESCHRPADPSWNGPSFNHGQFFALQGVHAAQACSVCHVNNVYRGTARECAGCHLSAYNATRNPNHAATGFPATCESCHRATDTSWTQGRFTHTAFPLNGPHNVTCSSCHVAAGSYAVFSCTTCHQRAKTDGDHRDENGYRYDSAACYACHPNGRH